MRNLEVGWFKPCRLLLLKKFPKCTRGPPTVLRAGGPVRETPDGEATGSWVVTTRDSQKHRDLDTSQSWNANWQLGLRIVQQPGV